ncbi:putative ring finger protein [Phaeoacremonium minimum UCRPA7]|uniref:Putative ring finger protein n=1 Tax=Phaeoacremonium minimum (strain UCR-PA7) TaxID=1286976 RepID=R8BDB5_PHAM7|nr:putative ring finger protein [Phaeoacremonium minimum UCRPA7]EON97286.1 putative ring finger protein [Phaeoacremonium minimum UCRPA7]
MSRTSLGVITGLITTNMRDLDTHRETFTCSVKLGVFVAKLDQILRGRTKYPIPDQSTVTFYRDGVRLNPFSEFDEGSSNVWYRVTSGSREDTSIKVTQWDEFQGWVLKNDLKDELARDIEAGKTVGDLRAKIATRLGIDDPNRIVLNAMRAVHVCPEQKYFVFRGFNRDYICHPEQPRDHHTEVAYIKNIIANILRNVHSTRNSKISLRANEINVIYGNRIKKSTSRIPWGGTIKFTIPEDVASQFEADETWLLPVTEMCTVCGDDKKVTEMPQQITAGCEHKVTICKGCLQQWIQSSMDTSEWDRLKCPECPQYLQFDNVKKYASKEVFSRYDKLATRAAVKDIQNFRWCLATGSRDEKASEKVIKETSKKCPKCNKDVHKYTGCNHITCAPPPLFARRNARQFDVPPPPPPPPPDIRAHVAEPEIEDPVDNDNDNIGNIGNNDHRARGPAPPVAPPPPRFAGTPHRVQEEMEFQRRRRDMAAIRDAALFGATAAAQFAHARRAAGPNNMNRPQRAFTAEENLDLAPGQIGEALLAIVERLRV